MMNQSAKIALAATAILGALLVPVSVFDTEIFTFLNGFHSPPTDKLRLAVTCLGDGLVVGVLLGAFLVVNPRITALGLLLVVGSAVCLHLVKALYPTLRPVEVLEGVHVVGPVLRSGAFPSGHAATAFAAALAIAHYCRSYAAASGPIIAAVLIGLSRIFVGVHFPKDVLGGFIIATALYGVVMSVGWNRLEARIPERPKFRSRVFRVLFSLELAATLFMIVLYAPFYSDFPLFVASFGVGLSVYLVLTWTRMEEFPMTRS